jgi:hypothetical protein
VVPPVIGPIELGDPQRVIVLDNRLGPGSTHRCAGEEQFLGLRQVGIGRQLLVADDGVGDGLQLLKNQRLIEFASRGRRRCPSPNPSAPARSSGE